MYIAIHKSTETNEVHITLNRHVHLPDRYSPSPLHITISGPLLPFTQTLSCLSLSVPPSLSPSPSPPFFLSLARSRSLSLPPRPSQPGVCPGDDPSLPPDHLDINSALSSPLLSSPLPYSPSPPLTPSQEVVDLPENEAGMLF